MVKWIVRYLRGMIKAYLAAMVMDHIDLTVIVMHIWPDIEIFDI